MKHYIHTAYSGNTDKVGKDYPLCQVAEQADKGEIPRTEFNFCWDDQESDCPKCIKVRSSNDPFYTPHIFTR